MLGGGTLVERGSPDEAGAIILGEALKTLRSECMHETGVDPREQVRLCLAALEGISALPPAANIGGLELGVPFIDVPSSNWRSFLKPLRDAVEASASPSDVVCPPLMGIEAQMARQVLSDHSKGLSDKRHESGDVYAAHHQKWVGGMWAQGPQGVYVGSAVGSMRARFQKRAADLPKESGSDALVKAMRRERGQPDSRFVLHHLHIENVDPRIHRGAGAVVRVAEYLGIEIVASDDICMNATSDVMQFNTLGSAAAAAMGK